MVDRYDPSFDDEEGEAVLLHCPVGDWVSYDDYFETELAYNELKVKFDALKELIEDMHWEANKIRR